MRMITIRLEKAAWKYDPGKLLGPPGGFGAVFAGEGSSGEPVAVKRLKVDAADAGHRELRVAEVLGGQRLRHVIPLLDSGCDPDSGGYFIVMGPAERSLQDLINAGPVQEAEAVRILDEIAAGFLEIPGLIHRDLKPGNVLFYDGRWVLADLGIARFVEESTSLRTLGDCLSPQYAAPEQWKLESSSRATDVYAFGGIIHALVRGRPPFQEPPDLRQQHLEAQPPALECSAALRMLAANCLRKSPDARPTWEAVRKQLASIRSVGPPPHEDLQAAALRVAHVEAQRESEATKAAGAAEKRARLAADALNGLDDVISVLFDELGRAAPNAERGPGFIRLNGAVLSLSRVFPLVQPDMLAEVGWDKRKGQNRSIPLGWYTANLLQLGAVVLRDLVPRHEFGVATVTVDRVTVPKGDMCLSDRVDGATVPASLVIHAVSLVPISPEDHPRAGERNDPA
jgi:eukaryotic-like serine/threonine-protein kinase